MSSHNTMNSNEGVNMRRVIETPNPNACLLEKRGCRFVRYADDFRIFVKSQQAGARVSRSIERFFNRRLKLEINKEKRQVAKTDDTTFLGFAFKGTKIRWSDKSFRKFKWEIKRLTGRSWFVSMGYRMVKIAQYPNPQPS
jgi:RNA-directed DNA polymerase